MIIKTDNPAYVMQWIDHMIAINDIRKNFTMRSDGLSTVRIKFSDTAQQVYIDAVQVAIREKFFRGPKHL